MSSNKSSGNSSAPNHNVNETVEAAMAMGKEKVEEIQENYTKVYSDFSKLGQETLGVYLKAGGIFAKGAEDIGQAYFNYAKATAENSAEAAKAVLAAKTLNEVVDVQNGLAKETFDNFIVEGTKISELSLKVAHETFEPIKEQVQSSVEKAMKPQ